jgi:hypothetical protein
VPVTTTAELATLRYVPAVPNDSDRYTLALDEARRALDRQADDVAGLRQRTTGLVSVGGLAAAFIGGLAVRDNAPLSVWTAVGVLAFAALLAVAVFALWPRKFVFTQHSDQVVGWVDNDGSATAGDIARDLALHLTIQYGRNAPKVDRLTDFYTVGLALLVVEIVAMLLDLRGR